MALGYAQGSIAGVDLESSAGVPCKVVILDGANLKTSRAVNNRVSAGGTLYTQTMTITAGRRFGVRLEFCPVDVLASIITAVNAALDDQDTFNVSVADDINDIDTNAVPDGNEWLKYEPQRTNEHYIKGVEMRFLTA